MSFSLFVCFCLKLWHCAICTASSRSYKTSFFDNDDFFPFFAVKLGHFYIQEFFLYVKNMQV